MTTHRRSAEPILIAVTVVILLVLGYLRFGSRLSQPASTAKPAQQTNTKIVVSVNQWQSIVSRVAGSSATVSAILTNSGVDAHSYEPDAADQSRLASADIVVVNGAGYDEWASKAAAGGKAQIINAAQLAHVPSGGNPHVWFSSRARLAVANAVCDELERRDPSQTRQLRHNLAGWKKDEQALESRICQVRDALSRASASVRSFAATESVADYLAVDLGLKDHTPTGYANASRNESEPAPADIKAFTTLLSSKKVGLLIVNTQEEDKTTQQLIGAAQKARIPLVRLTETRPQKYATTIAWMNALVDQFTKALRL